MRSLLTVDVAARPLVADITTYKWMTYSTIRPSWNGPPGGKHTIQNSVPKYLHKIKCTNKCIANSNLSSTVSIPCAHLTIHNKPVPVAPSRREAASSAETDAMMHNSETNFQVVSNQMDVTPDTAVSNRMDVTPDTAVSNQMEITPDTAVSKC